MNAGNILVLGGTGFIGRQLVAELVRRGCSVTVPTRRRDRAKALTVLPTLNLVEADVAAPGVLESLAAGCDAVVNLVGVLHSRPAAGGEPFGTDFERAHVALPRALALACQARGVRRLVHLGALGASANAPSAYLRSKAAGEIALLGATGLHVTVFRPSVVFGPDDSFLNRFAALSALLPVLMVACPDSRLQPVYVGDVVDAIVCALDRSAAQSDVVDLCGPRVYRLVELVRMVCAMKHRRRLVVGLPDSLSWLMAWLLEFTPGPVMTRDNYHSLQVESVSRAPFPFEIQPRVLEDTARAWLAQG